MYIISKNNRNPCFLYVSVYMWLSIKLCL